MAGRLAREEPPEVAEGCGERIGFDWGREPGTMRGPEDVRQVEEREAELHGTVGVPLLPPDVEGGPELRVLDQVPVERLLVDGSRPPDVHEHRVRTHRGELFAAERAAGDPGQRSRVENDVPFGDRLPQMVGRPHLVTPGAENSGAIEANDPHIEPPKAGRDRPPDLPVP